MTDPLPPNVSDFLALYAQHFPEVRFPELDLSVLQAGSQLVAEAAARVAEAEATLEASRAQLLESQGELAHKAYRALSFLKLYAQEDEEATALLEAVVLVRPAKRAGRRRAEEGVSPRRRGRERDTARAEEQESEGLFALTSEEPCQLPLGSVASSAKLEGFASAATS